MMDDLAKHFRNIDERNLTKDEYFQRLQAQAVQHAPCAGDRVVVACGLVGWGHLWNRAEAVVLEVGDVSVYVRFTDHTMQWSVGDQRGKQVEKWVHPALITDVLQ